MPSNYHDRICEQLVNLKQGNMTATKYMQKFDELKSRSQVVVYPCHAFTTFNLGLRSNIKGELLWQPLFSFGTRFSNCSGYGGIFATINYEKSSFKGKNQPLKGLVTTNLLHWYLEL